MARSTTPTTRAPLRLAAAGVGATFLLVGVLGFVPGIVTHFDELSLAGHESGAELLGIFQISVLHNLVHLLFGLAGLAMARREHSARTYLLGGGALYLVVWMYGLFTEDESALNFLPVNSADDFLHLGLGLGMIALGLVLQESRRAD